jgi:hypothetical protein
MFFHTHLLRLTYGPHSVGKPVVFDLRRERFGVVQAVISTRIYCNTLMTLVRFVSCVSLTNVEMHLGNFHADQL